MARTSKFFQAAFPLTVATTAVAPAGFVMGTTASLLPENTVGGAMGGGGGGVVTAVDEAAADEDAGGLSSVTEGIGIAEGLALMPQPATSARTTSPPATAPNRRVRLMHLSPEKARQRPRGLHSSSSTVNRPPRDRHDRLRAGAALTRRRRQSPSPG